VDFHSQSDQGHDPRLRYLVARSGDSSLFEDTDVPYFTRRNWVREGRSMNLEMTTLLDQKKADLIIQVLRLTAKCLAITASNRLLKAKIEVFGINTEWKRLPEGGKKQLLTVIENARKVCSLKECLATIDISGSRFHNLVRRQKKCQLQDYNTCPKSSPNSLTSEETSAIRSLFYSKDYAYFSIRALALYALINGYVACSSSTWYRQIRLNEWQRPRTRVYPKHKKIGIRKDAPNKLYHLDVTIVKLIDGTKVYIQILIDNFSRYVVAWSICRSQSGLLSVDLLRKGAEASRKLGHPWEIPEVFTDGGPENDNQWVDKLIESGFIIRTIAQLESRFSNSLVEALNRSLKVNCLYNHPLNTFKDVERLVNCYLNQHNTVVPHAAFKGATPLQMYTGTWTSENTAELKRKLTRAKLGRKNLRNSLSCASCS
jgi:putative transposase